MSDKLTIIGRVVRYDERGEWHTLLIQRDPQSKWEGEHTDKLTFPVDIPPYVWKRLDDAAKRKGAWVSVEFVVMGREWHGKHYVGISAKSITAERAGEETVDQSQGSNAIPVEDESQLPF
jgi:hypothetical protein